MAIYRDPSADEMNLCCFKLPRQSRSIESSSSPRPRRTRRRPKAFSIHLPDRVSYLPPAPEYVAIPPPVYLPLREPLHQPSALVPFELEHSPPLSRPRLLPYPLQNYPAQRPVLSRLSVELHQEHFDPPSPPDLQLLPISRPITAYLPSPEETPLPSPYFEELPLPVPVIPVIPLAELEPQELPINLYPRLELQPLPRVELQPLPPPAAVQLTSRPIHRIVRRNPAPLPAPPIPPRPQLIPADLLIDHLPARAEPRASLSPVASQHVHSLPIVSQPLIDLFPLTTLISQGLSLAELLLLEHLYLSISIPLISNTSISIVNVEKYRMKVMAYDQNRRELDAMIDHQSFVNDLLSRYSTGDILSRNRDRDRDRDETLRSRLGNLGSSSSNNRDRDRNRGDYDDDLIRRVNLIVQIANNSVSVRQFYAEIHPKMTSDGRYPRGFERPIKVEEFLNLEISTIDRLLTAYNLPRDPPSRTSQFPSGSRLGGSSSSSSPLLSLRETLANSNSNSSSTSSTTSVDNRTNKLIALVEYLGVQIDDPATPRNFLSTYELEEARMERLGLNGDSVGLGNTGVLRNGTVLGGGSLRTRLGVLTEGGNGNGRILNGNGDHSLGGLPRGLGGMMRYW